MAIASQSDLSRLFAAGDNYDRWLAYYRSILPRYIGTPMEAKIRAVIATGEQKKSTIATTMQYARSAWDWIAQNGSAALDALKSTFGLNGMGALPAIPLAYVWLTGISATAIVTAIAIMNEWVNGEAAVLKTQLDQFNATVDRLVATGMPVEQAVAAASQTTAKLASGAGVGTRQTLTDKLLNGAGKIVVGGVAVFVLWKIAERKGWI